MRAPTAGAPVIDRPGLERAVAEALRVTPAAEDESWALVREIAGFESALSAQLSELPARVVGAAAVHLGGEVGPAHPSLGVVVVQPKAAGILGTTADGDHTRFIVPRTEQRGPVTFVPVEAGVHVAPTRFAAWYEMTPNGLVGDAGAEPGAAWHRPALSRSALFDREHVRFSIATADVDQLGRQLRRATQALRQMGVGWLRLEVGSAPAGGGSTAGSVDVTAIVDPLAAFSPAGPGVLRAAWAPLDGLPWRPALLPVPGTRPVLRLADATTLELLGVAPGAPASSVVQPESAPAARGLASALWSTLERLVMGLPNVPPPATRILPEDATGWMEALDRAGRWPPGPEGSTLLVVESPSPLRALRIGLAFPGLRGGAGEALPPVEVWADDARRGIPRPASVRQAWALRLPGDAGGTQTVAGWDAEVELPATRFVILVHGEAPLVALLNALLVVNAPRVTDGRRIHKSGLDAETVALRGGDLVSRRTLGALVARDPAGLAVLQRFPVARFEVDEGAAQATVLVDATGAPLDEAAATVSLPGLASGAGRKLAPGAGVALSWYRRTDGDAGLVPPGAISLVEQDPRERTLVAFVRQPFATVGGRARDTSAGVSMRVLRPLAAAPVLPGEIALTVLAELGSLADDWICRVRPRGERVAGRTWTWADLTGREADRTDVAGADGGETVTIPGFRRLEVALGPRDRVLTRDELATLRLRLHAWFRNYRSRYPTLRTLQLLPLVPLVLHPRRPLAEPLALPAERLDTLAPSDRLVGPDGAEAGPRGSGRLWDAQIVRVAPPAAQGDWTREDLVDWLSVEIAGQEPGWSVDFWRLPDHGSAPAVSWWSAREARDGGEGVVHSPWADPAPVQKAKSAAGNVVSLGRADGTAQPEDVERLRPVVEGWWARVGRRCGRSLGGLTVLGRHPLRRVRHDPGQPPSLLDPWGGEREPATVPFFDAWIIGDAPPGPELPMALVSVERELEAVLRAAGWSWPVRVWPPRALVHPSVRFWEELRPPHRRLERDPTTAWVVVGPPRGAVTPREVEVVQQLVKRAVESGIGARLRVRAVSIALRRPLLAVVWGSWGGEPLPASRLGESYGTLREDTLQEDTLEEIGNPRAAPCKLPRGVVLVDAAVTVLRRGRTT